MSAQILNGRFFIDGFDWSGDLNAIDLQLTADLADRTTIIDSAHRRIAGLRAVAAQIEGIWNGGIGNVDDAAFNTEFAVIDKPVSIIPTVLAAAGDPAFIYKAVLAGYKPGAKVGDLFKFSGHADGTDDLVRGNVLVNGAQTVTGSSAVQQLNAVAAGQNVWAAAHILAVAGTTPSMILKLQSATTLGFAGPTDRITFGAVNAQGSLISKLAGPITDQFWRFNWTISGTTPSFNFVANAGIR